MEQEQFVRLAQEAKPVERETWELDLARMFKGIRDGGPVVHWGRRTRANQKSKSVPAKDCLILGRAKVTQILNSPLSDEFYSEVHGVELWLVRAVRRNRSKPG